MERLAHEDDIVPRTQTSAALRGGAPPIPPHNKPPTLVALMTPDPEDDQIENVIRCASEREAQETIRRMGYHAQKITAKPRKESAMTPEEQTIIQSVTNTIAGLYLAARDRVEEIFAAFNEGARMASESSKKRPKTLS